MSFIKLKTCPTCDKVPQIITCPSGLLGYYAIIKCCENCVSELYETREQALYVAIKNWNRMVDNG